MRSDDSRRARDPYRFFLLTFVLALPLYGLATFGSVGLAVGPGANLPLSALVFLCPLGAALLLVARREGAGGVGRLLRRLLELRSLTGWWWVPTLLLLPALYWLSFWCHRGLGLAVPGPSFAPLAILTLTGVFLSSAASEEVGWMGYAANPLQRRTGALRAALILGVVWGALHVIPDLQGGHDWGWIAGQRLGNLGLRVLMFWLYNGTRGSLAAAVLFHASDNVSVFTLFPDDSGGEYVPAITMFLIAGVALLLGPGAQRPRPEQHK